MTGKIKTILVAIVAISAITVLLPSGHAATYTFNDLNGYGTAAITPGGGFVDITLTDTALNPTSIIQNISGFTFQASSGGAVSPLQLVSPTSVGGTLTLGTDKTPGETPIQWGFSGSSSLYVLGWNPPAPPDYTIIGLSTNGYADANGSLRNNSPHNPFILQSATFHLFLNDITSETVISNGTIMFGTTWGTTTVPEPGALLLFGSGIVGLVVWRRKKRFE